MTKAQLARKRRAAAVAAARDSLRVLKAARRDVARIARAWRVANKRLQKAVHRLDVLDEATVEPNDTRDLLNCASTCLEEEREKVEAVMHRVQASQLSRGEALN